MSGGAPEDALTTALGRGREFAVIRELVAAMGASASGIGDDAAIIVLPRGARLVASVDAALDGVHFRRSWLNAREIGWRAATAALSDLAAMAARPVALLVSYTVPPAWEADLNDVARGIADAAAHAAASVVGGNTSAGPVFGVTTTVLGEAWTVLPRSGARAGDRVFVTGRLGGPAAAVAAWESGSEPRPAHRERFARPASRHREALWLAAHGATAAIDLSDGLVADLGHVAAASRAHVAVALERLPLVEGVTARAAAAAGEEYELIVCAPALDVDAFERCFALPLTEVGRVENADGAPRVTAMLDGVEVAGLGGHDHLTR